jgi:hypothetical protein
MPEMPKRRQDTEGRRLLKAWLDGPPKRSQADLARALKRSSVQVHKWLYGKNIPDIDSGARLEEVTDGAVPSRAWSVRLGRVPKAA